MDNNINIKNIVKDIKIESNLKFHNYIKTAELATKWIEQYTVNNHGIVVTSVQRRIYEEVTGYYIPTLLDWGFRDKAITYAKWLCSIQTEQGAWRTHNGRYESIFNTGQVMRGLVAICDILPEVKDNLKKACDWMLSRMTDEGRLPAIDDSVWKTTHKNSELIHLYCLPPLAEAGKKLDKKEYIEAAEKSKRYYINNYKKDIYNFNYLSHFYAYCLEALVDLGEKKLVEKAMKKIEHIQRPDGAVPAYKDCSWICTTGLFQFAIVWFKIGNYECGSRAFDYACKLQNKSGGWYGGVYPLKLGSFGKVFNLSEKMKPNYFPDEEISWAVKYFFDALYLRQQMHFEDSAGTFIDSLSKNDSKYISILEEIDIKKSSRILDVGCGKGRYLKRLDMDCDNLKLYGVDCSENVLKYVRNDNIELKKGSLLTIPYEDDRFDIVYTCEALEHAILTENAVKELIRVTKKGGKVIILDKSKEVLEAVKHEEWFQVEEVRTKQYFGQDELVNIMNGLGLKNVHYKKLTDKANDIYTVWVGEK